MKKTLWLHNIRSVHNVGSMFRTADALGVNHIYISGYTPAPVDRFGRVRADMEKIALGAEKNISWEYVQDSENFFKEKKEQALILAVEQAERSKNIFDYTAPAEISGEVILMMGEEVLGMELWQLELADEILEIPMWGEKESLNVSVSFGIAGYQIFRNL